jgi:predicted acetyltransferase
MAAGAVALELDRRTPADPARGWARMEIYRIMVADEKVGELVLRLGNDEAIRLYAGHVGYHVDPAHRGHGHAAAAVALLIPIAAAHGFDALWITCNPDNIASCRTVERAGGVYVETVETPVGGDLRQRGERWKRRYRLATGG